MTQPLVARRKHDRTKGRAQPRSDSARHALRAATDSEHRATERAFAPYDITQAEGYAAFLAAHAAALPMLEAAVAGRGWRDWRPRFAGLVDDLAALSHPIPAPLPAQSANEAQAWGIQYVLEGSRLGGRLLAQRVPDGAPTRYLGPTEDASRQWQGFCAALDAAAQAGGTAWLDEATGAAAATFHRFQQAAREGVSA